MSKGFSRIFPRLVLLILFVISGLVYYYRDFLSEQRQVYWEKFLIFKDSVFSGAGPEFRRRPISTAAQESQLVMYVGAPFNSFSFQDWRNFWKIIYGFHSQPNPEARWLPGIEKQYTDEEIRSKLIEEYTYPFAGFTDEHWEMFFKIALKELHD